MDSLPQRSGLQPRAHHRLQQAIQVAALVEVVATYRGRILWQLLAGHQHSLRRAAVAGGGVERRDEVPRRLPSRCHALASRPLLELVKRAQPPHPAIASPGPLPPAPHSLRLLPSHCSKLAGDARRSAPTNVREANTSTAHAADAKAIGRQSGAIQS